QLHTQLRECLAHLELEFAELKELMANHKDEEGNWRIHTASHTATHTHSYTHSGTYTQGRTGHRGYRGNPRWADEVGMVQNTGPLPSPTGPPTYTTGTFDYFPYYSEHVLFPLLTIYLKSLTDFYTPPRDLYSHTWCLFFEKVLKCLLKCVLTDFRNSM